MSLRELCSLIVEKNQLNRERRYWHRIHARSHSHIAFSVRENRKAQGKELMKQIKRVKNSLGLHCWWDRSGNIIAVSTTSNSASYTERSQAPNTFFRKDIKVLADEYELEKLLIEEKTA